MSAPTLYETSERVVTILDTYDLCETEEQRLECEGDLYRAVEDQVRKVDDFARFLVHLESQAILASQEIERLKVRRNRFLSRAERLEQYAIRIMRSLEVRKLEGRTASLTLRTNQPAVHIDDELAVPTIYLATKIETHPDKRAIKAALDRGETVPGAHLAEPSVSLIRS